MSTPPKLSNDCFALPPGVHWTPVAEALDHLRTGLVPVKEAIDLPLIQALGHILAAPVLARRDHPPYANAAVDGYGFAAGDITRSHADLELAQGKAAAGVPYTGILAAGQAVRILTGAAVPEQVDTIVLQEDVTVSDGRVMFEAGLKPGANVRPQGEDMQDGQIVLPAGRRLTSADIGAAASVGVDLVQVFAPLRVGILSTGSELVPSGEQAEAHQIYDANRPMLLSLVKQLGAAPVDLGQVPDDRAVVVAALSDAAQSCDVVLTSGGASAGDEDHISAALKDKGALHTWRIAIKPGRPLALGLWDGVPVFGLPGNPVAAFVCTLIFAAPAMGVLAGGPWATPPGRAVPAAFSKRKKPGRSEYLRARLTDNGEAEVFSSEGSGRVSGLSWADGLVCFGPDAEQIEPGDFVQYIAINDFFT